MANEVYIKESYVRSHIKMAGFQRTETAIIKAIPTVLFEALTGQQLVIVADALHAAHQAGRAATERDVLAEGAIYSPTAGRMLELV